MLAPRKRCAAFLLLLAAVACRIPGGSSEPASPGPEQLSLRVFELARAEAPSDEELRLLFARELLERHRPQLLDAFSAMERCSLPEVVGVQSLSGPEETMVDLVAGLNGGGSADFSFRLRAEGPGNWRVNWFQGPGVEWPPPRPAARESLSTSFPP